MKSLLRIAVPLLLCVSLLSGVVRVSAAADPAKHYICPPCGLPCDSKVFDQPGTCPQCGMALVDAAAAAKVAHPSEKKVGILIFNGVEIIDFTGPYEVFGAANYDVYTIAATKDPVTTSMGMTVVPKYTFADAPLPDVLVVPGGGVKGARNSEPTMNWLKEESAQSKLTMSVCNGAFILASAGLLDGLTATTTSSQIDRLKEMFPKITVVYDQRFVDNGRIITAAGLSSGIDGALHVVSRMDGEGTAEEVALGIEYDWRPSAGFARAALADRLIPDVDLDSVGDWHIVSTEGGTDHWKLVIQGTSDLSAAALMDRIEQSFTTKGKWTSVKSAAAGNDSPMTRDWKFSGRDGRPWTGTLTLHNVPGAAKKYAAELAIARVG